MIGAAEGVSEGDEEVEGNADGLVDNEGDDVGISEVVGLVDSDGEDDTVGDEVVQHGPLRQFCGLQ